MKVSFIIVNYNGKEHIERCIKSLLDQNFPKKEMEIIVVDCNSPDESWKLVKKYKDVKLIRIELCGYTVSNNIGIKASKGELIALINNDITLERDWTRKMVKKIREDKQIGVVGCKIYYAGMKKTWFEGGKVYFPGFSKHLSLKKETCGGYVAFSAVVFKGDLLKKELFDENIYMYSEDAELCKRISIKGWKVVYCPDIVAYHHIVPGRISRKEEYYIEQNRPYYYTKYYNFFGKIVFLAGDILLFFPLFAGYRILKDVRRVRFWKEILKARFSSLTLAFK